MTVIEAFVLGLIQGLTEFLPVSSSGHLELGNMLLGVQSEENLTFTVVVHGATVLSTIVVLFHEIWKLLKGTLRFEWNDSTKYVLKIFVSMIPVLLVGLFLEEKVESLFTGKSVMVGSMLLLTALLLTIAHYARKKQHDVSFISAWWIGVAQAFAVMPGISRSGATIAVGLLLGIDKKIIARFSFLMVLIPIMGANILKIGEIGSQVQASVSVLPLLVGFVTAFVAGAVACRWMIAIVRKGKLIYFAAYCAFVGSLAIGLTW